MGRLFDPDAPARALYGTDTRSQGLFVGATAALILTARRRPWTVIPEAVHRAALLSTAGLGLLLLTATQTGTLFRGGSLVVAVAVAFVVASSVTAPGTRLAGVLASAPLRWVGVRSYGVYLWHWPIDLMVTAERTGLDGVALFGVRVALTLALASASFRLIELPLWRAPLRPAPLSGALPVLADRALT
jgi:peptidoglycan/LPS O-acetylase OafA/YrhL